MGEDGNLSRIWELLTFPSSVLNPNTLLPQVPPDSKWFAVLSLCSAFFSSPVDSNSQYLFDFIWINQQYNWTVTSRRLSEAPSYFSHVFHQNSSTLQFSGKVTLLQYGDDYWLCSVIQEASIKDSTYVLQQLAEKGRTVISRYYLLPKSYLSAGIHWSAKRIKLIQEWHRPIPKGQLCKLLDLAGYC